ncbi:VOC family protein [Streptomyces sp. NPDC086091]|uniref:VOC family protein n=1 Tax=Streptomyces sp. NPDC086091 TaxID=3365751 RepID=UPI0038103282
MTVNGLGYLGLVTDRIDRWRAFAPLVLGLHTREDVRDPQAERLLLRADSWHHRLSVRSGPESGLEYLGWQVRGAEQLQETTDRLESAGLTVTPAEPDELHDRAVIGMSHFTDPLGLRHEIFYGPTVSRGSFEPGRPMSGFRTGEQGLGHVVLAVPDAAEAAAFYGRTLGARLSDVLELRLPTPGGPLDIRARFLYLNSRQHSLAVMELPDPTYGLQHLMLEVDELDDVGAALDLCDSHDVPVSLSLGRHANDHMVSFYLKAPDGFEIEYGWGGLAVDPDDCDVVRHDRSSLWGHRRLVSGPAEILAPLPGPAHATGGG